jgi:Alpha/beta hydrolase domain
VPVHDTDHLRVWEVAGAPHGTAPPHREEPGRAGWVANPLSITPVFEAAVRAVHRWVADGEPAPAQPRIDADRERRALRRDHDGNVRGGIRLPELAVATHEYRGMAIGTGRAPLFGSARPLPDDVVRARFRDRADHDARWVAAVDALVASGALRPDDAPAMGARAASVALPFD